MIASNIKKSLDTQVRILIVDDDPLLSESLSLILEELLEISNTIEHAFDAQTALEKLANEHFDIVLLDYLLPDSNGLEIIKKVKKNGFGPKIIFMTGLSEDDTSEKALQLGAVDHIPKGNMDILKLKKSIMDILDTLSISSQKN